MIIVASHAVFDSKGEPVHGTGSEIETFLRQKQQAYLFIKHALYGDFPTLVDGFADGKLTRRIYGFKNLPLPLRAIKEQIINLYFLNKAKGAKIFIGIDPLNAFSAILAKRFGQTKIVFYTADYTPRRFTNSFLNKIYHWFDRLACRRADQIWNVSSRIMEVRKNQGVSEAKSFLVPNSPIFAKVKRLPYARINPHDLVIVSHLNKGLDYPLLFGVIKKLSARYPDLRLLIIGGGPAEAELKSLAADLKMAKKILFLGQKTHEDVLQILAKSGVGIALYTQVQSWNKYGDSLKIREYLACGLPVITTDIPSTADDVRLAGAGLIIKSKENELREAIDQLFSDKSLYLKMRRNGIALAKKYDFAKIINERLSELNCL